LAVCQTLVKISLWNFVTALGWELLYNQLWYNVGSYTVNYNSKMIYIRWLLGVFELTLSALIGFIGCSTTSWWCAGLSTMPIGDWQLRPWSKQIGREGTKGFQQLYYNNRSNLFLALFNTSHPVPRILLVEMTRWYMYIIVRRLGSLFVTVEHFHCSPPLYLVTHFILLLFALSYTFCLGRRYYWLGLQLSHLWH